MIDVKVKTFLTLMEEKSTIQCAEVLHITQPAVTQHIRALEKEYEVKLFKKEGRCLVPTEKALEFYRMAKQLTTREKHIHLSMQKQPAIPLYYGATKSIAETILPSLTFSMLQEYQGRKFKLLVQNTKRLLEELEEGNLHFALIEGNVNHRRYVCKTLLNTKFICVCKKNGKYANCTNLHELIKAPLLLREEGSGSRDILEHTLHSFDVDIEDFTICHEFESVSLILSLVKQDAGITFIYEEVARNYIEQGILQPLLPDMFSIERQFTFVALPAMPFTEDNEKMYVFLKEKLKDASSVMDI